MSNKVRICSWDVGILNLAYCILEKDTVTNAITILDWSIIDLTEQNKKKCNCLLKNNTVCNKKASYYKDNTYYCNIHTKQYKVPDANTIKAESLVPLNVPNTKCNFSDKCKKPAKFTCNESHYCSPHSESIIKGIIKGNQLIKIKKVNATDNNLQMLSQNICTKIDSINNIYDIDEVLIEHQPVLKNPTIKTISCFIFHHFVVRCKNTIVKFISASNKLKIVDTTLTGIVNSLPDDDKIVNLINKTIKDHLIIKTDDTIQVTIDRFTSTGYKDILKYILHHTLNKKTKIDDSNMMPNIKVSKESVIKLLDHIKDKIGYNINKLMAVKYTNVLLTGQWINYLNEHTKKDDLCDAYLQGYYYLNK